MRIFYVFYYVNIKMPMNRKKPECEEPFYRYANRLEGGGIRIMRSFIYFVLIINFFFILQYLLLLSFFLLLLFYFFFLGDEHEEN